MKAALLIALLLGAAARCPAAESGSWWDKLKGAPAAGAGTPVPTLPATPTPGALPTPCPPPYPRVFKVRAQPVLKPERDYEIGGVIEPNVIKGPDGLFHMTYSSNAFSKGGLHETISLATSSDLIHWKRYGNHPIIGDGYGGQEPGNLGMSYQIKVGREWRIYYKTPQAAMAYASSRDGYHYKKVGVAIHGNAVVPWCGNGMDSAGIVFHEGAYWAVAEVMRGCPTRPAYVNWLFKSTDGAQTFQPASSEPLVSQAPHPERKMEVYCGARSIVKVGNRFHAWLHIGIPTSLYHSVSEDLYNWKTDPEPCIIPEPTMFGLKASNQAADTSIIEHRGKTYLFYDGTDNINGDGRIGVAIYDGTLADYDRCAPRRL